MATASLSLLAEPLGRRFDARPPQGKVVGMWMQACCPPALDSIVLSCEQGSGKQAEWRGEARGGLGRPWASDRVKGLSSLYCMALNKFFQEMKMMKWMSSLRRSLGWGFSIYQSLHLISTTMVDADHTRLGGTRCLRFLPCSTSWDWPLLSHLPS